MPKAKKFTKKSKQSEASKVEKENIKQIDETQAEPEPIKPTEEELQKQRDALLQDPQTNEDITLVFDLEAPSEKMQKYILHRKEQYVAAHQQFKQNHASILSECNHKISTIANDIRCKVEYSNKIFEDILDTFSNEQKLSNISAETDIDECWKLIDDEFTNRQALFEQFATKSNKVEAERKASIQREIQILFQTCVNTGLVAPNQIKKSLEPKMCALNDLMKEKASIYNQFAMKLNETDSNLRATYEDQFKDGKLRWNQVHRKRDQIKENENINKPNVADSKS